MQATRNEERLAQAQERRSTAGGRAGRRQEHGLVARRRRPLSASELQDRQAILRLLTPGHLAKQRRKWLDANVCKASEPADTGVRTRDASKR
jgi:hypothetical protein